VEGGVVLCDLQDALGQSGQFLPLDVPRPDLQTIGGLVATRPHALRRAQYGGVRDLLLGACVVDSRGDLIKAGGRVVKNVAGYDLAKMYCGSFGTLGLIVEATFRTAPLPKMTATVALPLDESRNSEEILDELLSRNWEPSFVYLINGPAARDIWADADKRPLIVMGFDGTGDTLDWQLEQLSAACAELPEPVGTNVRRRLCEYSLGQSHWGGAVMTARLQILSSQVGAFARMMEWTAAKDGFEARVVADVVSGTFWVHFLSEADTPDWQALYSDFADKSARVGGSVVIERMPAPLREKDVPVWAPLLTDFALMRRLKEALDPGRIWNPGRFIGRI